MITVCDEPEMAERKKKKAPSLRVMEFYSGIGGMRYSLSKSGANAQVIQAFDINNTANDVYEYNFGHRPSQSNIETLTCSDLDRYTAEVWLLSPPCQPYTRQGHRKHSSDSRSSSFLHLLHLLTQIQHLPLLFLLENVVGFEISDTHHHMMQILSRTGFSAEEFILSPSDFGVPYSRPRYFCLARRIPSIPPSPSPFSDANLDPMKDFCDPVKNYLEIVGEEYRVPMEVVERWGAAMDIVYPESKRCCCFTKSYCRYVKGTGSVLCEEEEGVGGKDWSLSNSGKIRYFSPREVANLHSFPPYFEFPHHISLKQRYALLGNSLSIAVVSPLLTYLFSSAPSAPSSPIS